MKRGPDVILSCLYPVDFAVRSSVDLSSGCTCQGVHLPFARFLFHPTLAYKTVQMSDNPPAIRGELAPGSGLIRRNAVRGPRRALSSNPAQPSLSEYGAGSSGTLRGAQSLDTNLANNVAPPSQSALASFRHTPNTTADKSLLINWVSIPPNLQGLEGAVCHHEFEPGSDGEEHSLKSDRHPALSMWRNRSEKYLVSLVHIPIDHRAVSCH
jgi:hypothetical protein